MHTKIGVHTVSHRRSSESHVRPSSLKSSRKKEHSEKNQNFDDAWVEEDVVARDTPLIERLHSSLGALFSQSDSGLFLSYCPNLPRRVCDEAARISRDEPGGISACRIHVKILLKENISISSDDLIHQDLNSPTSVVSLGNTSLSENGVVETFEIDVYLFPAVTVFSRLQAIMTSLSLKHNNSEKRSHSRNISLLPDFVLVKRKLFRSNNNKPFAIFRSFEK